MLSDLPLHDLPLRPRPPSLQQLPPGPPGALTLLVITPTILRLTPPTSPPLRIIRGAPVLVPVPLKVRFKVLAPVQMTFTRIRPSGGLRMGRRWRTRNVRLG